MPQPTGLKITKEHEQIKNWAIARGGRPVVCEIESDSPENTLGIRFGKGRKKAEKKIDWSEFFNKMDDNKLGLAYQDVDVDGEISKYCNVICPWD